MVRLYLVRHGKAAAAFSEAPNPGLERLVHHGVERATQVL